MCSALAMEIIEGFVELEPRVRVCAADYSSVIPILREAYPDDLRAVEQAENVLARLAKRQLKEACPLTKHSDLKPNYCVTVFGLSFTVDLSLPQVDLCYQYDLFSKTGYLINEIKSCVVNARNPMFFLEPLGVRILPLGDTFQFTWKQKLIEEYANVSS